MKLFEKHGYVLQLRRRRPALEGCSACSASAGPDLAVARPRRETREKVLSSAHEVPSRSRTSSMDWASGSPPLASSAGACFFSMSGLFCCEAVVLVSYRR